MLAVNDGYRVRNVELGPVGIPFVRGGDINDGGINTAVEDHIRPEFADRVQSKLTRPYDVAFISKGTVGRVGLVRPGQPASVFAPQVCYWRSLDPDHLEPRFLFYLLTSAEFRANLDAVKTHGSMVADYVSMTDQRDFRLTFPPIREQNAIAAVLGALDDKIELNRRMNSTLEAMARALFQSWFVDFDPVRAKLDGRHPPNLNPATAALFPDSFQDSALGHIPKGWSVKRIGDLVDVVKGRSYRSEELADSKTALVTLKSFLRGGGYRADGLKPFTGEYKPNQRVAAGDLVVAFTDVTQAADVIGKPALVRSDERFETLVASLDVGIVRPKSDCVSILFLYCLFLTEAFQSHTYSHATGTTVLHLSPTAIPSFKCVIPNQELAAVFARNAEPLFELIDENAKQSRTLAALRDTLLPKLLSGEISVK
ncbi:restriction endonuclease subunit S [Anatilimnocola aggregata]|uniref:restriction endonuclease subunit S n=1 Tax=Anatilimnocola aggregata TaxID=2528021 RepID=UPI001EE495B0|nr:restriction endonuclease subunit S [Anatilimnocola aggregata]